MNYASHISIFGTQISITNSTETPKQVYSLVESNKGYICLPDAFVIVSANKNKKLQQILNNSLLSLPDGQPIALYARFKGIKSMSSVSGYKLIQQLLATEISHFFYGSTEEELYKIRERITSEFPLANVVGYKAPPWVELDQIENNEKLQADIRGINQLKPNIIWVGFNSPKQDYFMAHYLQYLDNSIMIGVGGVFDYLSGKLKFSPEWIKKLALRWVYRIIQNPKRYFRRNVYAVFHFTRLFAAELLFSRKSSRS